MSRQGFVEALVAAGRVLGRGVQGLGQRTWTVLDFLLLVAGVACVVHGVAQWSTPAAWVLGGAAIITFQYRPTRRS